MNISFIGYGKIAQSLINGWLQANDHHFQAAAPSLQKSITTNGIRTTPHNLDVTQDADIIILAVKPAQMANVLAEIGASIPRHCLLISVAAGLNMTWFAKHTQPETAVIRAMPNIAAAVRQSATPLIKNQYVSEHQQDMAEQLFNSLGITTWVKQEVDIDIFTALSGSGPAYVFQFIQSMVTAAVNMGLDKSTATAFALKTVSGATALAIEKEQDLQQLTNQVTSKGGTTAAALHVLHDMQFSLIVESAMIAAKNRAQELDYT